MPAEQQTNEEITATLTMNDHEMIHCQQSERQLDRAIAIMHRLRAPGGCPWDAVQTHESIIPNLIEECYECIDAIRAEDWGHLREELGDVLLQVLFHAEMAQGNPNEQFDIYDVARELSDKLVRRHPHVFGEVQVHDAQGVLKRWDEIKQSERHSEGKPPLHDTGKGLPELLRALKISAKASKMGFDWSSPQGVCEKLREELREAEETLPLANTDARVEEELGDLLFTAVNLCRHRGVNPELALRRANEKFVRRFHAMLDLLRQRGISTPVEEEMEQAWTDVKAEEEKSI